MAIKHEKIRLGEEELFQQISKIFEQNNLPYKFNQGSLQIQESKKHYVIKINPIERDPKEILRKEHENIQFPIIVKLFNKQILDYKARFDAEMANYEFLQNMAFQSIQLPKRVKIFDEIIVYEFIQGDTLLALLRHNSLNSKVCELLAAFFSALHNCGKIFGDCRLNNFIFHNDSLFILDYEDIKQGVAQQDVAQIASAFIDNYPGIFERCDIEKPFLALINFLKAYFSRIESPSPDYISLITKGIRDTAIRRGKSISKDEWEKIERLIKELRSEERRVEKACRSWW